MINLIPAYFIVLHDDSWRAWGFIVTFFRSFKLKRSAECFKIDLTELFANRRVINLVIFLGSVLLLSHYVACGWILLARLSYDDAYDTWLYTFKIVDRSNSEIYLAALYWEMSTLTTVGYGDISANTEAEIQMSIVWMLFGVAFYSYVISILTSSLVSEDAKKALNE
jgi:hypothetical protein